MFPGLGGVNPKQMQALMKQMGISQTEVPAKRVIIEKEDDSKIVIEDPTVLKIKMQGQETFQVSGGSIREESGETGVTESDIKTVMEKTGCTKDQAKSALENSNGDLAEAILSLGD